MAPNAPGAAGAVSAPGEFGAALCRIADALAGHNNSGHENSGHNNSEQFIRLARHNNGSPAVQLLLKCVPPCRPQFGRMVTSLLQLGNNSGDNNSESSGAVGPMSTDACGSRILEAILHAEFAEKSAEGRWWRTIHRALAGGLGELTSNSPNGRFVVGAICETAPDAKSLRSLMEARSRRDLCA